MNESIYHQSTAVVLMISPEAFEWNAETAQDNSFMNQIKGIDVGARVLSEHNAWVSLLRKKGCHVTLFSHTKEHQTPDACFPNNWISTHNAQCAVLYPMKHESRQRERRDDILKRLIDLYGFSIRDDLIHGWESKKKALEGTGALVLDRIHGVAYMTISQRGDEDVLNQWVDMMNVVQGRRWKSVLFRSTDANQQEIYHTNVMMAIGTQWAVVCVDCIEQETDADQVVQSLLETDHVVIEITRKQVECFCANIIEVQNDEGEKFVVMSSRAQEAFDEKQLMKLKQCDVEIIHSPLNTLEDVSGGGIRCCIAELFL